VVTECVVPPPLVRVGDVIDVPEADYCYGRGRLRMRVTAVEQNAVPVEQLEWVRLCGVPIYERGNEGDEREALVRVAALRQHPPERA
jgi:hypothetical protein